MSKQWEKLDVRCMHPGTVFFDYTTNMLNLIISISVPSEGRNLIRRLRLDGKMIIDNAWYTNDHYTIILGVIHVDEKE